LPIPGEVGRTIRQTRGALRGMWMDAVPRFCGGHHEKKDVSAPTSGKGFGGGSGPVGKPKGGTAKDEREGKADGNAQESDVPESTETDRGKAGKKGGGECYLHGPFLGDMLPGQTLRMKRGLGGVSGMTAMIPEESNDEDADLSDDIYSFIRRTPLPWTPARMMQVASLEFRNVNRDILRATITGVLTRMKKTAQHILMASIRNGPLTAEAELPPSISIQIR